MRYTLLKSVKYHFTLTNHLRNIQCVMRVTTGEVPRFQIWKFGSRVFYQLALSHKNSLEIRKLPAISQVGSQISFSTKIGYTRNDHFNVNYFGKTIVDCTTIITINVIFRKSFVEVKVIDNNLHIPPVFTLLFCFQNMIVINFYYFLSERTVSYVLIKKSSNTRSTVRQYLKVTGLWHCSAKNATFVIFLLLRYS